jgi:uncharacterized membrane protein YeaQ/YmgE (transglycosylase-associated protein family)
MLSSESLLSSELLRTAVLGLVIGGLGGLAVPGHRMLAWPAASALGVGGAFFGAFIGSTLFGSGFPGARMTLAGLVAALLVCCWALYLRERFTPR